MNVELSVPLELDAQYRVMRESAGWLQRRSGRALRVRGGEAAEYLQGQLTNDVEALAPGEGQYSALLDRKGHMQGDMRVLRLDDGDDGRQDFWIETEGVAADAILRHLSMYRVGRDADVDETTAERALVSVIGPAAAGFVAGAPLGAEHAHRELTLDGTTVRAVATDLGLDLIAAPDALAALETALGERDVEAVGEPAAEIVRVESGRPRFGAEMTTATIPQEAGINERAVSFTKGCYIGQETVARLHYKGRPNRHLRGLRLSTPGAVHGDPVALGDRELGAVGTAVLSPAHGPIALAILRREAEPGTAVTVAGALEAEVVEPPFASGTD